MFSERSTWAIGRTISMIYFTQCCSICYVHLPGNHLHARNCEELLSIIELYEWLPVWQDDLLHQLLLHLCCCVHFISSPAASFNYMQEIVRSSCPSLNYASDYQCDRMTYFTSCFLHLCYCLHFPILTSCIFLSAFGHACTLSGNQLCKLFFMVYDGMLLLHA